MIWYVLHIVSICDAVANVMCIIYIKMKCIYFNIILIYMGYYLIQSFRYFIVHSPRSGFSHMSTLYILCSVAMYHLLMRFFDLCYLNILLLSAANTPAAYSLFLCYLYFDFNFVFFFLGRP